MLTIEQRVRCLLCRGLLLAVIKFLSYHHSYRAHAHLRCTSLEQLLRILDNAAKPSFVWEAFIESEKKYCTLPVHTSLFLEKNFVPGPHDVLEFFEYDTDIPAPLPPQPTQISAQPVVAPGCLPPDWFAYENDDGTPYYLHASTGQSHCNHPNPAPFTPRNRAIADISLVKTKCTGLGTLSIAGKQLRIRRRLLPDAKIDMWQYLDPLNAVEWLQCDPATSAELAAKARDPASKPSAAYRHDVHEKQQFAR
jgi:hypothetical protein